MSFTASVLSAVSNKRGGVRMRKKDQRYLGELIRFLVPSLYGKPVYDKDDNFIRYTIIIPKIKSISSKELENG